MILFLIKDTTKKSSTYIYLLLILLLTTGLILTTSRAAFLSGVLLLIIYILRNAINDYSLAISIKPDNANAYHNRGASKQQLGEEEIKLKCVFKQ